MVFVLSFVSFVFAEPSEAAEVCPDIHELVISAQQSLFFGAVDESRAALDAVAARFDCQMVPDSTTIKQDLGEYALVNAYLAHLDQQTEERELWLQQSVNLDVWNVNFGPEIDSIRQQMIPESTVHISTSPSTWSEDVQLWIDGEPASAPIVVSPGLHWMWMVSQGELVWQQVKIWQVGDSIIFPVSIEPFVSSSSASASVSLASASFLGSLALVSHVMATWKHSQLSYSDSLSELDIRYRQTQLWGWSSVALAGGATASLWFWQRSRKIKAVSDS